MIAGDTRTHRAGRVLLIALIPMSAVLIGSVHAASLIVVGLIAALSCALLWWHPPGRKPRGAGLVLGGLLLLCGVTVVQLVPLPASVVATLAPSIGEVWARSLAPLHESGPAWHPLTLAPAATRVELLKGLVYLCVFLASLRVALSTGGTSALQWTIIASASLVALATLAHAAVDAHRVFGIYEPHDALGFDAGRRGPLLNPNHLAAYVNAGAAVAMEQALRHRRDALKFTFGGAAFVLLAGTSVWAGSRGGTGALVCSVFLVGTLFVATRRNSISLTTFLISSGMIAAAVMLVAFSSSDAARADLLGHDVSKLMLARKAFGLTALSPIFGIGRGSFDSVYPILYEGDSYVSFRAVENFFVQWCVEWGIVAGVAAPVLFLMALRPRRLLDAAVPPIGAWVAVVLLCVHDLVDFHLEVPAVALLGIVCFSVIVGSRSKRSEHRSSSTRSTRSPSQPGWRRAGATLAAATAFLAAVATASTVGRSIIDTRDEAARLALDSTIDGPTFRSRIRAMMLDHPAEPFIPLAGAIRAQRTNDESVIPWVARALERYPNFGRAHLVLARSLRERHPAQARLEYRLACRWDRQVRARVAAEIPPLVHDYSSAIELVPDGGLGESVLEALSVAIRARLPATSAQLDREQERRNPAAVGPRVRQVEALIADVRLEHPWCADRTSCASSAIQSAQNLVEATKALQCEHHALLARARIAAGDSRRGLDDLARAVDTAADRDVCLQRLVELALEVNDTRRVDDAMNRVLRAGCGSSSDCVRLFVWAAGIQKQRGNRIRAVALYKRAAELDPAGDYLQAAAELAEQAGLFAEAMDLYERLATRYPTDPTWRQRADEVRARARSVPAP